MKVKTDNPNPTNFCFYYATGEFKGASGDRIKVFPIQGADAGWQYVIVDMTTQSDWQGQINYIRLDAFDSVVTPENTNIYIGSITLCSSLEEAQAVESGQLPAGSIPSYLDYLASLAPEEEEPADDLEIKPQFNEYLIPIVIGAVIVVAIAAVALIIIKKKTK